MSDPKTASLWGCNGCDFIGNEYGAEEHLKASGHAMVADIRYWPRVVKAAAK